MTADPVKKAAFELSFEGDSLDFAHLEPLDILCPTSAQPNGVRINVRFSCHCFTEAFDEQRHAGRPVVMDGRRQRAFCPDRFELSKNLPVLIAALPGAHVYLTPEANFMHLALAGGVEYRVYFNLKRSDAHECDLRLFVESAYLLDKPGLVVAKMQKVRFKVLVDKIVRNEPLRFHRR